MAFLGYLYKVCSSKLMFYFYYQASFLFIIAISESTDSKVEKKFQPDEAIEKEENSNLIAS